MKRILIGFAIALIVEVAASFWVWERQPSHGLVDIYDEPSLRYEAERVVPWLIAAIISVRLMVYIRAALFEVVSAKEAGRA